VGIVLSMAKSEFKVVPMSARDDGASQWEKALNDDGMEGWELVSTPSTSISCAPPLTRPSLLGP
jgi:hypothetical protein